MQLDLMYVSPFFRAQFHYGIVTQGRCALPWTVECLALRAGPPGSERQIRIRVVHSAGSQSLRAHHDQSRHSQESRQRESTDDGNQQEKMSLTVQPSVHAQLEPCHRVRRRVVKALSVMILCQHGILRTTAVPGNSEMGQRIPIDEKPPQPL